MENNILPSTVQAPKLILSYVYPLSSDFGKTIYTGFDPEAPTFDAVVVVNDASQNVSIKMTAEEWIALYKKLEKN